MISYQDLEVINKAITMGPYIYGFTGLFISIIFLVNSFILEEKDVECWKQIIPIYNIYIWFKTFWKPKYFYIMMWSLIAIIVGLVIACTQGANRSNSDIIISTALGILLIIVLVIFDIILNNKISLSFGHGVLFTIGLILLNPIFMIVLGIQSLKNGVINKIPSGRKVFIVLWTILTILVFVGIGFIYSAPLTAFIKNY